MNIYKVDKAAGKAFNVPIVNTGYVVAKDLKAVSNQYPKALKIELFKEDIEIINS